MASIKRVYWDACTWIAYIKQEVIENNGKKENRFEMCKSILKLAESGKLEIVTSAFTLAEVCKSSEVKGGVDHLPSFFEKSYILLVPVDKFIALKAQAIQLAGIYGLKPPDAIHVASALAAQSTELHTFDDGILSIDQKMTGKDGSPMRICKPNEEIPPGPLLQIADNEKKGK